MLTQDRAVIVEALKGSPVVEIGSAGSMLRPREAWANWVLPVEQRDRTAHAPPSLTGPSTAAPLVLPKGDLSSSRRSTSDTGGPQLAPAAVEEEAGPPVTPAKLATVAEERTPVRGERTPVPEQRRRVGGEELDGDDMFQLDEVRPSIY